MFSQRLPGSLEENRISRAVANARARGPLLDLTETNPTAVGLAYPTRAILEALTDERALTYQPTPRGLPEARRAAAAWYARHGVATDEDRVFLTASTSEAYALLFKLLCDPGDEVLVPEPSYPLFGLLAGLEAVATRAYPLRYHAGWFLDGEELAQRITPRTRAVLVVNPNNPTGSFLTGEEHAALDRLCAERGLALVSDEVFAEYAFTDDVRRTVTLAGDRAALTFCMNGLSKLAGLPQLKLGWIALFGPTELRREADRRLELIADTYLSVATPVQLGAERLLALSSQMTAQLRARVLANRARLEDALRGSALDLLDADGGWSAILRVPRTRTEEEHVLALLDAGILVHPGYFFDLGDEGHLVVSLIVDERELAEALPRLVAAVEA